MSDLVLSHDDDMEVLQPRQLEGDYVVGGDMEGAGES